MVYTRPLKKDLIMRIAIPFFKKFRRRKSLPESPTHLATSYSPPVIECSLKLNGVVCVTVP